MTEDSEALKRAKAIQASYRKWAVGISQQDCRCSPVDTCDPCRARAFLKLDAELADAARKRAGLPEPKKPRKRKPKERCADCSYRTDVPSSHPDWAVCVRCGNPHPQRP